MLKPFYSDKLIEAGCDEAGRGCLAGPVFAAAVIFARDFRNEQLNDSKKLPEKKREELRKIIEEHALAWAVASVSPEEIDDINILNASYLAMHRAVDQLKMEPELLLIDGNRFNAYKNIPHKCIVKGDAKYMSIAAASVLAKTHRDAYMLEIHQEYPGFGWDKNKGYPTRQHKLAIYKHGLTSYHRKSFNYYLQLKIDF